MFVVNRRAGWNIIFVQAIMFQQSVRTFCQLAQEEGVTYQLIMVNYKKIIKSQVEKALLDTLRFCPWRLHMGTRNCRRG